MDPRQERTTFFGSIGLFRRALCSYRADGGGLVLRHDFQAEVNAVPALLDQ
jgi:hypothetical protein